MDGKKFLLFYTQWKGNRFLYICSCYLFIFSLKLPLPPPSPFSKKKPSTPKNAQNRCEVRSNKRIAFESKNLFYTLSYAIVKSNSRHYPQGEQSRQFYKYCKIKSKQSEKCTITRNVKLNVFIFNPHAVSRHSQTIPNNSNNMISPAKKKKQLKNNVLFR